MDSKRAEDIHALFKYVERQPQDPYREIQEREHTERAAARWPILAAAARGQESPVAPGVAHHPARMPGTARTPGTAHPPGMPREPEAAAAPQHHMPPRAAVPAPVSQSPGGFEDTRPPASEPDGMPPAPGLPDAQTDRTHSLSALFAKLRHPASKTQSAPTKQQLFKKLVGR